MGRCTKCELTYWRPTSWLRYGAQRKWFIAISHRRRSRRQFHARARPSRRSRTRIRKTHRLGHWYAAVCRIMSDVLDATLIQQNIRAFLSTATGCRAARRHSGDQRVHPGPRNIGLSKIKLRARCFRPYHDRIKAELERRLRNPAARRTDAMHSFTPVFMGVARHGMPAYFTT